MWRQGHRLAIFAHPRVLIASLLLDLDVSAGQEAPIRREGVTVISRRAGEPDAEPVHADAPFAVVLYIHAERVAGRTVDRGRAVKRRMFVITKDADKGDGRTLGGHIVGCVAVAEVPLEAIVVIRLSDKAEITGGADLSAATDLAGTTNNGGAGRHAGHAFVVDCRNDVESADGTLRGVGMISRDGK